MAVLDVGSATAEQLHNLKQHPSLKQAFFVYVSREAALKASLAAAGAAEAAVATQLANLAANQEAVCAVQGLLQVAYQAGSWCSFCVHCAMEGSRGRMRLKSYPAHCNACQLVPQGSLAGYCSVLFLATGLCDQ